MNLHKNVYGKRIIENQKIYKFPLRIFKILSLFKKTNSTIEAIKLCNFIRNCTPNPFMESINYFIKTFFQKISLFVELANLY